MMKKIKKKSDDLNLALNKTEDILKTLGQREKNQVLFDDDD